MMTKPPGLASTSSFPPDEDDDEESIDDSLEDILLEANEKAFENVTSALSPGGLSPGVISGSSRAQNEVTLISPRPSIADEVVEEETKVEPLETAIRAAASKESDPVGLTTQASEQRERALHKPLPAPRVPTRPMGFGSSSFEFEDPDGKDADEAFAASSSLTPSDIPISDDDEPDEPQAPAASGFIASPPLGVPQPRRPPPGRLTPPPGRPEAYTGRRLPTPSSDFLPGPAGYGSGTHYPSIPIPAPSTSSAAVVTRSQLADKKLQLPFGALAGILVVAFAGGLTVGAAIWRGSSATATAAAIAAKSTPAPAAPSAAIAAPAAGSNSPAVAPVVEPVQPVVAAAPAPVPAAASKPSIAPMPATTTAAAAMPAVAPLGGATAAADAAPVSRPVRHVAVKTKKLASTDIDASGKPAAPARAAGGGSRKKASTWQDPFAQ